MPGIKRKEYQGQSGGQSPPKKFKQEDGHKKAKSEDGETKYKKNHTKQSEDGKPKQQIVKELLGGTAIEFPPQSPVD